MQNQNIEQFKKYQKVLKQDQESKKELIVRAVNYKKELHEKPQKNKLEREKQGQIPCIDEKCEKTFKNQETLAKHVKQKHRELGLARGYFTYQCELCNNYVSNTKWRFEAHLEKCVKVYQEILKLDDGEEEQMSQEDNEKALQAAMLLGEKY